MHSESILEVNLDRIAANLSALKQKAQRPVWAVVKANAYGLGAVPVAKRLAAEVEGFCVATPSEALELAEAGLRKPILVFGYVAPEDREAMIQAGIRPALSTLEEARAWDQAAASMHMRHPVHIALDTGHRRIGFASEEASSIEAICTIAALPNLYIEGMYSHFSTADEPNEPREEQRTNFPNQFAMLQLRRFKNVAAKLEEAGVKIPVRHIANDAGFMTFEPDELFEAVRPGIGLYGHYPSEAVRAYTEVQLQVPYRWTAPVSRVKWMDAGESVGYGRTWISTRPTRVATVQVGYADGYPRLLSNRAVMLVQGVACPVIGRVCMDQVMLDITDAPDIAVGERVLVMGAPDWETPRVPAGLSADDLADQAETISYEMLTNIAARVERRYISGSCR